MVLTVVPDNQVTLMTAIGVDSSGNTRELYTTGRHRYGVYPGFLETNPTLGTADLRVEVSD